ncbi:MAG TPA: hypothetical protein VK540_26825 [Polyangiaceae bacterium]|jgi:hypothetical protein|nr:hypothetical protein [Polyangiaceae bacterium]
MRIEHLSKFESARKLARVVPGFMLVVAGWGCGGGTPPPAAPEPAPQASAAPAGSSDPATAQASDEPPKSAPSEPAPAAKPPTQDIMLEKPTRPVRTILESQDMVYFVSYEESDVGKTGEANCAKESGGDPQKNSACMGKARQGVEGLGYRFKKKGEVTTCTMLRRQGNVLNTTHKFRYKYGDETETSVVIKMDGKDEGPNRWEKIPSEFKVELPNDYTLVIQDPKYGRLVYYAKSGIPGD